MTPSVRLDADVVAQYADLGVHRLIALMPQTEARTMAALEDMAALM